MQVREYLNQAYRLNELINSDLLELEELKKYTGNVNSVLSWTGSGGQPSDIVGNIVVKIDELGNKINDEIDRYVDVKKEIRAKIESLSDRDEKLILKKRYINFQTWEKIAVDLNYSYRHVMRLYKRALKKIKDVIECPNEPVIQL